MSDNQPKVLTQEALNELINKCKTNDNYFAEVVMETCGDARSKWNTTVRGDLYDRNSMYRRYPIDGFNSGTIRFYNGSYIVFRGCRQGLHGIYHEILYEDRGRSAQYGRSARKKGNLIDYYDYDIYDMVTSFNGGMDDFIEEFKK